MKTTTAKLKLGANPPRQITRFVISLLVAFISGPAIWGLVHLLGVIFGPSNYAVNGTMLEASWKIGIAVGVLTLPFVVLGTERIYALIASCTALAVGIVATWFNTPESNCGDLCITSSNGSFSPAYGHFLTFTLAVVWFGLGWFWLARAKPLGPSSPTRTHQ